jgi:PKD repeat protein
MVWSIYPNTNYGQNDQATLTAWTYGGMFSLKRFYVKFDLSAIPTIATIDSAFYYFYNNPTSPSHNGEHSGQNEFIIQRAANSWSQNTINFNNQPGGIGQPEIVVPPSTSPKQDFKVDITPLIEEMIKGVNNGLYMRIKTEETYRSIVCASGNHSDSNLRPMLVVYYTSCDLPLSNFNVISNSLGNSFAFIPQNQATNNSYYWDFGDGQTSTQKEPRHTFTASGRYKVCLTIEDSCGTSSDCKSILVSSQILLGPNPTDGFISWQSSLLKIDRIRVFNAIGQLVEEFNGRLENGTMTIDDLAAGTYYLRFETNEGDKTKKIIIRH